MAESRRPASHREHARLIPELVCADYERSLAFYKDILGFLVDYARPEDRFAFLDLDGAQLMIEQPVDRAWITGDLTPPFGRGINFQIEVDDIQELHNRCRLHGIRLYMELEDAWYRRDDTLLGNRQFLIQDPDGYLLRFFQDLGERPVTSAGS